MCMTSHGTPPSTKNLLYWYSMCFVPPATGETTEQSRGYTGQHARAVLMHGPPGHCPQNPGAWGPHDNRALGSATIVQQEA